MMRITETVKQLIIINIIFYIGSQVVGEPAYRILAAMIPEMNIPVIKMKPAGAN